MSNKDASEGRRKGHDLKIAPTYYDAVLAGKKKFEIRNNDRDFKVGDIVNLKWFDSKTDRYSIEHPDIVRTILYMTAYEQKPGYVVFSI